MLFKILGAKVPSFIVIESPAIRSHSCRLATPHANASDTNTTSIGAIWVWTQLLSTSQLSPTNHSPLATC